MAKLYFYYSTMNAGKSTALLQAAHNYAERGMSTRLFTARLDDRAAGRIASRIGIEANAERFDAGTDFWALLSESKAHCILIDEAQFLNKEQARQLARIVDELNIPVMCYGLRTDFRGELFPGSAALLAWADTLSELKTICFCGRKATMVVRVWSASRSRRQRALCLAVPQAFLGSAQHRHLHRLEKRAALSQPDRTAARHDYPTFRHRAASARKAACWPLRCLPVGKTSKPSHFRTFSATRQLSRKHSKT